MTNNQKIISFAASSFSAAISSTTCQALPVPVDALLSQPPAEDIRTNFVFDTAAKRKAICSEEVASFEAKMKTFNNVPKIFIPLSGHELWECFDGSSLRISEITDSQKRFTFIEPAYFQYDDETERESGVHQQSLEKTFIVDNNDKLKVTGKGSSFMCKAANDFHVEAEFDNKELRTLDAVKNVALPDKTLVVKHIQEWVRRGWGLMTPTGAKFTVTPTGGKFGRVQFNVSDESGETFLDLSLWKDESEFMLRIRIPSVPGFYDMKMSECHDASDVLFLLTTPFKTNLAHQGVYKTPQTMMISECVDGLKKIDYVAVEDPKCWPASEASSIDEEDEEDLAAALAEFKFLDDA